MTNAPATPQRERLSLDAQLDKLRRVFKRQEREYERLHAGNNMDAEKRAESVAGLGDIFANFKWFVANADWIKAEDTERKRRARIKREQDEYADEAVGEVLDAFPGATITQTSDAA